MNATLQYTLVYADFAEFQKIQLRWRAKKKWSAEWIGNRLIWFVVAALIAMVVGWLYGRELAVSPGATFPAASEPEALLGYDVIPLWGICVFSALVVWFFLIRALRPLRLRKAWKSNKGLLQQPRTVDITSEVLAIRTSVTKVEHQWPGLHRFAEGPSVFLIYTAPGAAHIIPKRAFASPADVEAFRLMARSLIIEPTGGFPVLPAAASSTNRSSPNDPSIR